MTFEQAILQAKQGKVLMLPNYIGYFKWNYSEQELYFQNRDYITSQIEEEVKKRTDWFYII